MNFSDVAILFILLCIANVSMSFAFNYSSVDKMFLIRVFLILILFHWCLAATGLLWDKYKRNFISILKIPNYEEVYEESHRKIKNVAHQNLQGRVIKFGFYNEPGMVDFKNNNTKVSGVFGELWNTLSEFLNFTIAPRLYRNQYGSLYNNRSGDGIIGVLERKNIDLIPRINCDLKTSKIFDCTLPIWKTNVYLYTRTISSFDKYWVFEIFNFGTLIVIAVVFSLSIILGIMAEKIYNEKHKKKINLDLSDRIFYTFTTIFPQGWRPSELEQTSRILDIFIRFFSWFVIYTFSSALFVYLQHTKRITPFQDFTSLFDNEKYRAFVYSGSVTQVYFERSVAERIFKVYSRLKMFQDICSSKNTYGSIEAEDIMIKPHEKIDCSIEPVGSKIEELWISSAVAKGFPFLHSFNTGILKMHEGGLMKALKNRYYVKYDDGKHSNIEQMDIERFYMVYVILGLSTLIAMIFFIMEHIFFWHQKIRDSKSKRFNRMKKHRRF